MIKITADSTCDLPVEIKNKYNITISPIHVIMNDKDYSDGVDINPQMIFYACGGKSKVVCKSSACNPVYYYDMFKQYTDLGSEVVHISLSSEISSSYRNAVQAAEKLNGVYVVDSRNLTTASGLLVCMAAELAEKGLTGEEVAKKVQDHAKLVKGSFILDTLDYLAKGGRCSSVTALGANLLSLKPCIEVNDGKMSVGKKYRGNIFKCMEMYVKDKLQNIEQIDPTRVFVTSTIDNKKEIDTLVKQVKKYDYFEEIIIAEAGSVISTHCGPNTLGLEFMFKE